MKKAMIKRYCDFCGEEIPDADCSRYDLVSRFSPDKPRFEFDACELCLDSVIRKIKNNFGKVSSNTLAK